MSLTPPSLPKISGCRYGSSTVHKARSHSVRCHCQPVQYDDRPGEDRGCGDGLRFFVVVRTGGQRRSSFSKPDYFEAFATHYVVDGRTGELLAWVLKSFEAPEQDAADRALDTSAGETSGELISQMKSKNRRAVQFEEVPDERSPAAVGLKPPIPYRRIKPEYTTTAFLYDVRATIDIEATAGPDGKILDTRIVRWAGSALDGR